MLKYMKGLCFFSILFFPPISFALDVGMPVPDFKLPAADGDPVTLSDQAGQIIVLEWFNSGCPFVQHQYATGNMQKLQDEYAKKGVVWLTINSTAKSHRDYMDSEKVAEFVKKNHAEHTTFLDDSSGKVGKLFGAKSTPHMFVINSKGILVYEGAIDDDSDLDSDPAKSKNYVKTALDEVLANRPVSVAKTTSYGCSIKFES